MSAAATSALERPVALVSSSAPHAPSPRTERTASAASDTEDMPAAGSGSIPSASSTSRTAVKGAAPWRSRSFVPAERPLVISPGTAKTSRPSSSAKSAVIRAPDRSRASTTTVASERAAMIRLRAGNRQGAGSTPGGYSETTAPDATIRRASSAWLRG